MKLNPGRVVNVSGWGLEIMALGQIQEVFRETVYGTDIVVGTNTFR
jgi:hypothetical protein